MVSKSVARGLERAHSYSMSSNPDDWEKARVIRTNIDLADMVRQTKAKRKKKVVKEETSFSQRDKIIKKVKSLHKHLYKSLHKKDTTGDVNERRLSYYGSKEEREDKEHDQRDRERKLRMKHGKRWKEFTRDVEAAKKRLRPGEVRTFNKETGKWESNKD